MDSKKIEPIDDTFENVSAAILKNSEKQPPSIPSVSHDGDITIGQVELSCYVLEDGTRVLSNRGISTAFTGNRGGGLANKDGAHNLPRFLASQAIKPFISNDLMARLNTPIEFQPKKGRTAFGYEAILLPEICEVILDAEKAGALKNEKQALVADLLIRGFARVGIVALVDEATGYQEEREKDALAQILEQFLSDEKMKWAKTFPIDFYKEIYRLRNWEFKPWTTKRPSVIAKWTDDFIYDRIAPTITEELRKKNPKSTTTGRRKGKHHQWFNPENGHPRLKEHISGVIALLRAADSWDGFKRSMNRAYPKFNETIEMQLDNPNEK